MSFSYSENEEIFHGECNTREDALAEGRFEYPGATIWTGENVKITTRQLMPPIESMLDHMSDAAFELCGEHAEGWPKASPEAMRDLEESLIAAVDDWLGRHGLRPTFFYVERVQKHDPVE